MWSVGWKWGSHKLMLQDASMCFSVWQWISVPSQTFHFPNSYWNVIQTVVCSSGGNSAADLMLLKHTGTEVVRSTGIILDSHTDQHVFQWGTLISVMFFYEIFDPYVCSCHICPYVSIYARTIGTCWWIIITNLDATPRFVVFRLAFIQQN